MTTHDHPAHDHESHDDSAHGHAAHDHDTPHQHGANLLAGDPADVVECPVLPGSMVNKAEAEAQGRVRDYNGVRYYLCCNACGPLWDANPAKYAAA